jgi:hypothetical protein
MKLATAEKLKDLIDDMGIEDEVRVNEDYSGRGMYGDTTAGVVVNDPISIIQVMAQYALDADGIELDDEDHEFLNDIKSGFRTDSMGYDTIVY